MGYLKKNKKAFLLAEETLKIIIAVICIVFLIYILLAIYNASTSDKKLDEAKADLFGSSDSKVPGIQNITVTLKDGESQIKDISDPSGWHLYSFVEQEKPNACTNDNCICICKVSLITLLRSQASECDKEGACLVLKNLAKEDLDLKIKGADNLLFIQIKKENGDIFIEQSQ